MKFLDDAIWIVEVIAQREGLKKQTRPSTIPCKKELDKQFKKGMKAYIKAVNTVLNRQSVIFNRLAGDDH